MPARYRRPVKRGPKSDPQQYRLYRMENENIGAKAYTQMTRKLVDKMVRSICKAFRVPRVVVRYKNLGEWAAMWEEPNIVTFGTKAGSLSPVTVAHELAHHVHHAYAGEAEHQAHGPEFMCLYMTVLDRCRIIPAISLRPLCEKYKVRYIDPGDLSKPVSVSKLRELVSG